MTRRTHGVSDSAAHVGGWESVVSKAFQVIPVCGQDGEPVVYSILGPMAGSLRQNL